MAKNFKFPDPNDYPPKSPAVLCPSERVLNLYNQDSGHRADRVSKKVKLWFAQEAHARDWAGVRFLPEVQTQHTAGESGGKTDGLGEASSPPVLLVVLPGRDPGSHLSLFFFEGII